MIENFLVTAILFMLVHFGSVFNRLPKVYSTFLKMKEKEYFAGCPVPPPLFSLVQFTTFAPLIVWLFVRQVPYIAIGKLTPKIDL